MRDEREKRTCSCPTGLGKGLEKSDMYRKTRKSALVSIKGRKV